MALKKINLSNEADVRNRVYNGIDKMCELVGMTLGPNGRSILIERGGEPLMVDDGRRTAENIKFDDRIEQMAVRVAYEVTKKTDERAGDGTTTSMILLHGILKEVHENHVSADELLGTDASVSEVDRALHESKDRVVKALRDMAKEVKTEKDLINVASISSGDPVWGKAIGSMYYQLGKDGHITLEFNLIGEQLETEVVTGYRFTGGYAAKWMITDEIKQICQFEDADILVLNSKEFKATDLQGLLNELKNRGRAKLVIIAPKFQDGFIQVVYRLATKANFPILCVRAPSRGSEAYKDIAIFTGAKLITKDEELSKVTRADLGTVQHIEVSDDTCILTGGAGDAKEIKKRVAEVQADANLQKVHQFKNDRLERSSALFGGVGVIKIGAPTNEERNWIKHKIEDAKWATKIAYKEGVVPGGGMALKIISDSLPDDDILKIPLLAPYERLKRNNGGKWKVPAGVVDPVAVEIAALEYAVSATSKLLRVGGAIAFKPKDELSNLLGNNLIEDDEDED